MRNDKQQFSRSEQGQGMVELAVSLIVILILLAGMVDISRTIMTKMALQDAAEEGVLFSSIDPKQCAQIKYRVYDNLKNKVKTLTLDQISITYNDVTCPGSGTLPGQTVKVSITTNVPVSMPFLGAAIGSTRNITAESKGIVLRSP